MNTPKNNGHYRHINHQQFGINNAKNRNINNHYIDSFLLAVELPLQATIDAITNDYLTPLMVRLMIVNVPILVRITQKSVAK